mgnify:CR=1 FL=1
MAVVSVPELDSFEQVVLKEIAGIKANLESAIASEQLNVASAYRILERTVGDNTGVPVDSFVTPGEGPEPYPLCDRIMVKLHSIDGVVGCLVDAQARLMDVQAKLEKALLSPVFKASSGAATSNVASWTR